MRIGRNSWIEPIGLIFCFFASGLFPSTAQTQLTWMAERDPRAKNAKPEQFIDGSI